MVCCCPGLAPVCLARAMVLVESERIVRGGCPCWVLKEPMGSFNNRGDLSGERCLSGARGLAPLANELAAALLLCGNFPSNVRCPPEGSDRPGVPCQKSIGRAAPEGMVSWSRGRGLNPLSHLDKFVRNPSQPRGNSVSGQVVRSWLG